MPFILFLICIFLIFCVLYGISSGVNTVAKGISQATKYAPRKALSDDRPMDIAPPNAPSEAPITIQQRISELQALFAMHQEGALTRNEFEHLKKELLESPEPAA